MNRTSQALRRFGVPVLAATSLLTAGQIALGTSAFAAQNGTLTITPSPGYASATPANAGSDKIQQKVTYVSGDQSQNPTTQQVLTVTVSGSATLVAPAAQTGTSFVPAGNGKSGTCTTGTPAGGGAPNNTGSTATCDFAVIDTVSEAVTVTVHDSTDQTTPDASATDNWAALSFSGCATIPNTAPAGNCTTQQGAGTTQTVTVTYLEAGAPAAGKEVDFTICDTGSANCGTTNVGSTTNQANFPTQQSNANTVATSPGFARCTTDAQGHCSVTIQANGTSGGNSSIVSAVTVNTAPYPASKAQQQINYIASTTPGRFTQGTQTWIKPTPTAVPPNGLPGEVLQTQYTLTACTANSTTGKNACLEGTPLAGQTVTLTVDHGFFTPNCTKNAITNYANCTFNTTPAAGTPVGDLKSLGSSTTATTDANGQLTVSTSIARDAAFDQAGAVVAQVTAAAGGVTLIESVPSQSASTTTCNAPGTPAPNAPQAGCPTGSAWTTDAAPLNGGSVSIVSVPNPNSSTEPALDSTKTNNVPNNQTRVFVIHLTDQFGNLTSGGAASGVTLTKTGVGDLFRCTGAPAYDGSDSCLNPTNNGTNSTDANGVTTTTYTNVKGSYTAFTSAQSRFEASPKPFTGGSNQSGTQTLTASWAAPVTTFNTFAAGPPAVATYSTSTATKTATVTINWFTQTEQAVVTFSTTPSNRVKHGTVVTVSATVKDQFGNPIAGDNVQFVRSGPTTGNGTSCTANGNGAGQQTNAAGQAGFSFTCNNVSTQVVTIVVQDGSGNELARGTQTIHFTGKVHISASINCFSPTKHHVVCKVHVSPRFKGLTVNFFNAGGRKVGTDDTNRHGNAYFRKAHMKSGRHHSYHAHVKHSSKTFGEDTGSDGVTVK